MDFQPDLPGPMSRVARWAVIILAGVALSVGVALRVGAAPADAATGVGDSVSCGSVVTRNVTLRHDLVNCPGNELVIGADDVDVDLDGHVVSGVGVFASQSGVDIDGFDRVSVRDGRITGFSRGVLGYATDQIHLEGLTVTETLEALSLQQSSGVVTRNRLIGNREGLSLRDTADVGVVGNLVAGNRTNGITDAHSGANHFHANRVQDNAFDGIGLDSASAAEVVGNMVGGNGLDGINAGSSDGVRLVGNRVVYNDEHGINGSGDRTFWRRNAAYGNGRVGLLAGGADIVDAGGNRARGNGEADCVELRCR